MTMKGIRQSAKYEGFEFIRIRVTEDDKIKKSFWLSLLLVPFSLVLFISGMFMCVTIIGAIFGIPLMGFSSIGIVYPFLTIYEITCDNCGGKMKFSKMDRKWIENVRNVRFL